MRIANCVKIRFWLFLLSAFSITTSFADPVVSNVRAQQRPGTGLVDIYYDLTGTVAAAEVTVEGSDDSGVTYSLSVSSLTGDVGTGVSLGPDRHIVWDALSDSPQVQSTSMRIKVNGVEWVEAVPLVTIPAGSFAMGDTFEEGNPHERPVHTVELSGYWIGETEVTWGQWQEVRDWAVNNGYTDLVGVGDGKGADHPVHSVNSFDAVKWCNAASEKVGLQPVYLLSDGGAVYRTGEVVLFIDYSKSGYRLPTEAEWEKAARGGLKRKRFPWGDTISHAEANYYARPDSYSYGVNGSDGYHPDYYEGDSPYTSPVRSFAANGYGLYDVAGNLWEWCGDWYGSGYYGSGAATDPVGPGPDPGLNRVIRGGVWGRNASYCRVAYRNTSSTFDRNFNIGFRLARRLSGSPANAGVEIAPSALESADFSLNTVTWTLAGTFSNGSVTGMGTYLDKTTATLTAVSDPGYVFATWETALLNTLVDVPLTTSSAVSVVDYGGDAYFTMNGIGSYVPTRRYLAESGNYTVTGIPYDAPLAIINGGKESEISYIVDNSTPIEIYVSGGSTTAPFYTFEDAEGNDLTGVFQSGYTLMRGRTYRFIADGISTSHPFMINSSRFQIQENWVTGSPMTGTGGIIELTVPDEYLGVAQFYCTVHTNMNGYFNLSMVSVDGTNYDAYWGTVELNVSGDFGAVDVRSTNAEVLGGEGLLVFNDGTLLTAATNPITILVDEDKTVGATFIEDLSDADADGLTAYQEHVLYGTDPDLEDTDGDTHSDFVELINFGSDPLDAASVPTYQVSINAFNGTVTGAGAIEIQTETTLLALADEGYVFAGWAGDASGGENPLTLLVDDDKTIGADFIANGNYTRIEQLAVDAGYTTGLSDGISQGIAQGEALVVANPRSYDLLNTEMVYSGLRLGGMRIQNTGSSQLISFNIESSDDLMTWTLEERIERELLMPQSGPLFIRVSVPAEDIVPLVTIPAGSFQMGDTLEEGGSDELPVHTVELSAYKVGETEVTWAQWQEVRDWAVANEYTDLVGVGVGKGADHPVHSVNWFDVVKWCNAASEKIGLEPVYLFSDGGAVYRTGEVAPYMDYSKSGYRLPTEAEWEKAARGGLEGARFPWGDTISHGEANYIARPNSYSYDVNGVEGVHPDYDDGDFPFTSPVRSFLANGYGLYDVAGNLQEWCGDWYDRDYYGSSAVSDPAGPESGWRRVIRDGSWAYFARDCRVASRYTDVPSLRNANVGFRVSRSL